MSRADAVCAELGRRAHGVCAKLRVVRGREIACRIRPDGARPLAELLRADFGAELLLMVGADRRADAAGFEVCYLFAHPTDDWFLHAVAGLPARG